MINHNQVNYCFKNGYSYYRRCGVIGSEVAKRFIEEGHNVYGIDDLSSGLINNVL